MITLIAILHVIVCVLLIIAVLLQGGENVDITAAFGGTSQAAFGPRGAVTLLAKITWVLGLVFVMTSITLAIHASHARGGSVLEHMPAKTAPAVPGPAKK